MSIFSSIRDWQSGRKNTKQLRSLSVRQLEDTGISRNGYKYSRDDLPFIK